MNIFLHEMRRYRKSVITWALSMAAMAALYILLYKSILSDIDAFGKVLESVPEALRNALGILVGSLSTLPGFYSSVFIYFLLCGGIQAMNLGVSIVSKETSSKTADFLLTKPVSRANILTAKLMAALASLAATNLIFLAVTVPVALSQAPQADMGLFLMISATLFLVQLMFAPLGILVAVLSQKIRSVVAVSLPTVFGFFIAGMLGSIIGEKAVRYVTPFKYFDLSYILANAAYETSFLVVGALFIVAAIVVSYLAYLRKDIHAV
jgi:ABC-2 type transport system permease protein